MTAPAELSLDTSVFTTLMEVELTDNDRSHGSGWSCETRLSLLAWEISRYAPEMAVKLCAAGREKFAMA